MNRYERILRFLRRHWIGLTLFVALAGTVVWLINAYWSDWICDYIVLEDQWKGPGMPEIDEVQVTLLGNPKKEMTSEGKIDDYADAGTKIITSDNAQKIAELWRDLPRNPRYAMLCFDPAYGLRFREKGHLILETTICWHCNQYTLYPTLLGFVGDRPEMSFDGHSPIGQALLKLLEEQVPPPKNK